ncbi:hypothetical protein Tco_1244470 [Tanacetum coccineum]
MHLLLQNDRFTLTGKEVDIGLDGRRDKPLRPADMLLYSWDGGLDVCVDLTRSSPLTQTWMVDFVPDQAVIDVAQRKRDKYMVKCAAIGYGFLPFSFSSLGELEADAVTLLKRIRKFSMAQDIGARVAVHIFNRISFAIAKGVGIGSEVNGSTLHLIYDGVGLDVKVYGIYVWWGWIVWEWAMIGMVQYMSVSTVSMDSKLALIVYSKSGFR